MSAFSFSFSKGVIQLALTLAEEREDHLKAAAAWALGQIGRHTPEHAKAVALANVLPKLLECYLKSDSSEDLQQKVVEFLLFLFKFKPRIVNFLGDFCVVEKSLEEYSPKVCLLASPGAFTTRRAAQYTQAHCGTI
jgi:hypothetical protein